MAKQTHRKQSLLYTPFGIGFLLLVFLYMCYSVYGVYGKFREARAQKIMAEESLASVESRHSAISDDLRQLSTDRGKEEIIREKFQVVREGEGVIVLPGEPETDNPPIVPKKEPKKTFWGFLKGIFSKEK